METKNTTLLFYCNSGWLSTGNALLRTIELRQDFYCYLYREGHNNYNIFTNSNFVTKSASLYNTFEKFNSFSTSL